MTIEEEAYMDGEWLNKLIGKQCRVVVENTVKDKKTYSNIKSFLPIKEIMLPLTQEEKDKATVKKKDEEEEEVKQDTCYDPDTNEPIDNEINAEEVVG